MAARGSRIRAAALLTLACSGLAACAGDGPGAAPAPPSAAPSAAPSATPTATATGTPPGTPTGTPTGPARVGPEPLGPVAAGERPPQVVVVSFDGAGVAVEGRYPMFAYWRDVGRRANARFTFFLSGPYLLTHDNIAAYDAPQLGPARQEMPLQVSGVLGLPGQSQTDAVRYELEQLRDAYAEGNEIGTHFNGHICGDQPGSVARFTADDWRRELDGFDTMIDRANETNGIDPPVDLGFTSDDVTGSRTPCLEGDFKALYPVLAERGYAYDTSPTPDTTWPRRGAPATGPSDVWVFPLAWVPSYGTGSRVLSMDYNLCHQHEACKTKAAYPAADTAAWSQQALDTYRQYFRASYTGDRAPVSLGNHFEMWHDGAYTKALAAFVTETCTKPEVRCVSYRELAAWLGSVPEDQRSAWRAGDFPHYADPTPPAYGKGVPGTPVPEALS